MKTGKHYTLLSIVLLGALLLGASFTVHGARYSRPERVPNCWEVATNHDLKLGCGHDIILVLDESGSIAGQGAGSGNHRDEVIQGARALLESFKNTGSRVALLEFATNARFVQLPGVPAGTYLEVTDATLPIFYRYLTLGNSPTDCHGNLSSSIYSPHYSGGASRPCRDYGDAVQTLAGYTNWQAALEHTQTIHEGTVPAHGPADLVVFMTDGNPTTHQRSCSGTSLECAIRAADRLKNSDPGGSGENHPHMLVVGVGSDINVPKIKAISGCDQLTLGGYNRPPPTMIQTIEADYTTVHFSQLVELFRGIAFALCGNSVNVTKLIDPDGPDHPAPAAVAQDIEFQAHVIIREPGPNHPVDKYEWVGPERAVSCPTPETGMACPGPGDASRTTGVGMIQNAWTSSKGTLNFDWVAGSVEHPRSWKSAIQLLEIFPDNSTHVYREMTCLRTRLERTGDLTETVFTCRRSRTVPLLPDQPSPACEDDPDNIYAFPRRTECGDLASCADLDVGGIGAVISVFPNDIVNCHVINDDVSRLPVTLNHFSSTPAGESIEFKWDTLSETELLGFRLWAVVEGQRVTLGERLVLSNSSNSATPQSYKVRRSTAGLAAPVEAVGITSIDISGPEQDFGPYNIGETFGERVEPQSIDWKTINSSVNREMERAGYRKSGKRWVRQGAAPANGDPGVGNAEITE